MADKSNLMDDCSSNISLQPAGTQDSLCDAGNYADYVDNCNQKGLVYCQKEKNYLWNLGCVFDCTHSSFSEYVPEKQTGGISNCAHTGDVFQR